MAPGHSGGSRVTPGEAPGSSGRGGRTTGIDDGTPSGAKPFESLSSKKGFEFQKKRVFNELEKRRSSQEKVSSSQKASFQLVRGKKLSSSRKISSPPKKRVSN